MIDVAIFSIPAAIIGARLYYIVFAFDRFNSFYDAIAVWNGGLAVYGGIIFGFATAFLVAKIKKLSILKVFDSTAPAIMLGQIIGRWGNFTNAEAFGIRTELPWEMTINARAAVHPIFLYECLWNLVGFAIINLIYKNKKFDGQIFLIYCIGYGAGRFWMESLRTDQLKLFASNLAVSQVFSVIVVIAGTAIMLYNLNKSKNIIE